MKAILRLVLDLKSEIDAFMGSPLTNGWEMKDMIRLEKELEYTNQKLEKMEIENKNIAEIRDATLKEWRDSDRTYVSTSAMTFIHETLQYNKTVNDIQNICLYDFFPLLCALYSKMKHRDPRFFIYPVEIIEKEISEMKIKSEPSFLCLSLLVLKNNKCGKDELRSGDFKQLLEDICRDGGIETVVSIVSIQKNFERFKGIYISESDESYKAIHDKMFDIISAAIAPSIMECLIEHVDIAFLANRVQFSSLGKISLPFVIYIPKRLERIYLQRQYKAVMKGKYWEVFGSLQTENEAYRNLLLSFLKDQDISQPLVPGIDGATPLFVSSSLGYVHFVQYFTEKSPNNINVKDKKCRSSFYISCKNGHIATVKYLLQCCADTNIKDTDGLSALHAACCSGHTEIVKILIESGMHVNDATNLGLTPFLFACRAGHHETVKFLLDLNAKTLNSRVDLIVKDLEGYTALHAACFKGHTEVVKILIDAGMNVNDTTNKKFTPLFLACRNGRYDTVKYLLDLNAQTLNSRVDSTIRDNHGRTALHISCSKARIKVVQILIDAGMNVHDTTNNASTPLILASCQGHFETVKFLLDLNAQTLDRRVDLIVKDSKGFTALHRACFNGHTEVVKILVNAGMNVNETTNDGFTSLILACRQERCDTETFLLDLNDAQAFNGRVDLSVKDSDGMTALHAACNNGRTEVVKILIDAGMNVNDTTNNESTPLIIASCQGHFDTVKFLLDLNAQISNSRVDLTVKDLNESTALHIACYRGHTAVVRILIDAGMDVNNTTVEGFTPLFLACQEGHYETVTFLIDLDGQTLNSRADLLVKSSKGRTALHAACYKGHTEVVKLLIDAGMNVNDTTAEGFTPLFLACQEGRFEIVKYLLELKEVYGETVDACTCLTNVTHRVNTATRNELGSTALHVACLKGNTEVVKLLVDVGMNINDSTKLGFTPLYLACQRGRYNTVKFLLDLNCRSLNSELNISKTDTAVNTSIPNIPSSVDTTIRDPLGMSVLHIACSNGYAEVAKLLIDAGLDINDRRYDGKTALHLGCLKGHCNVVKSLMDSGAQKDICDKKALSPLIIAQTNGHSDVVKLLENMDLTEN